MSGNANTRPAGSGAPGFWESNAVRELKHLVALTSELAARENTSLLQIAVIDGDRQMRKLANWPVAGAQRFVVPKRGHGNPVGGLAVPQNATVLIASADAARLGGQIVNAGANPVVIAACDTPTWNAGNPGMAIPQHWLTASGGSWDLRDGNVLVCSSLVAWCTAVGGSTIYFSIW